MDVPDKEFKQRIDFLPDSGNPDPMIDKAWARESKSRLRAMRSGLMKAFPYQDVMATHLK